MHELVRPLDAIQEWEPDVLDWARKNMVRGQEYSVAASIAVGSIQHGVNGEFKGLKRKDGNVYVHLSSEVMEHYIDVDFIREIRPLRRVVDVW